MKAGHLALFVLTLAGLPRLAGAAECALPDADQLLQDSATEPQCDRFAYESPLWVDLLGDEPAVTPPVQSPPAATGCELAAAPAPTGARLTECPSVTPTSRRAAAIARVRSRLNPPVRSHRTADGFAAAAGDELGAPPPPAPVRTEVQPIALPHAAEPPLPALAQNGWPEPADAAPPDATGARLERPPRA